jgi:N-methylhydantoinase A
VRDAVEAVAGAGVEAVAVCLLFSFLHPEHEQRVGAALRAALPGVRVSLSCELLPEFREYERCSTTVANAYLAPALSAYLEAIEPRPLVMQSSGGVADVATAAARPAACVLSEPAAARSLGSTRAVRSGSARGRPAPVRDLPATAWAGRRRP